MDEITVVGSRCGRFEAALGLLQERRVDPTPLLQYRYPLEAAVEAFETAQKPGVLKVILSNTDD